MNGRLLLIEARRSVGLWALLALPLWWWLNRNLAQDAPFWNATSLIVRNTIGVVGPILGGAAAWMAGRESRSGMADLLATTARPQLDRRLTTWLGVVVWGVVGYLLVGAIVAGFGVAYATWGGPFVGPILVGLVALPVYAALGFAFGRRFPARLVAPLVAITLLIVPFLAGQQRGWYAFLSPLIALNRSVWYGLQPDLSGLQIAFLLSLGGAALATLALPLAVNARSGLIGLLALVPLAATTIAIALVAPIRGGQELSTDPRYRTPLLLPYTPVCAEAPLPVCVHPAYRAILGETTADLNRLVAPLLGLPGVPTRAEQGYAVVQGRDNPLAATTLWFDLNAPSPATLAFSASRLVRDPGLRPDMPNCPAPDPASCTLAQVIIERWLLRQVGLDESVSSLSPTALARVTPVIERFAALDPATRRAWLDAHFSDLRAGRVSLEELP